MLVISGSCWSWCKTTVKNVKYVRLKSADCRIFLKIVILFQIVNNITKNSASQIKELLDGFYTQSVLCMVIFQLEKLSRFVYLTTEGRQGKVQFQYRARIEIVREQCSCFSINLLVVHRWTTRQSYVFISFCSQPSTVRLLTLASISHGMDCSFSMILEW